MGAKLKALLEDLAINAHWLRDTASLPAVLTTPSTHAEGTTASTVLNKKESKEAKKTEAVKDDFYFESDNDNSNLEAQPQIPHPILAATLSGGTSLPKPKFSIDDFAFDENILGSLSGNMTAQNSNREPPPPQPPTTNHPPKVTHSKPEGNTDPVKPALRRDAVLFCLSYPSDVDPVPISYDSQNSLGRRPGDSWMEGIVGYPKYSEVPLEPPPPYIGELLVFLLKTRPKLFTNICNVASDPAALKVAEETPNGESEKKENKRQRKNATHSDNKNGPVTTAKILMSMERGNYWFRRRVDHRGDLVPDDKDDRFANISVEECHLKAQNYRAAVQKRLNKLLDRTKPPREEPLALHMGTWAAAIHSSKSGNQNETVAVVAVDENTLKGEKNKKTLEKKAKTRKPKADGNRKTGQAVAVDNDDDENIPLLDLLAARPTAVASSDNNDDTNDDDEEGQTLAEMMAKLKAPSKRNKKSKELTRRIPYSPSLSIIDKAEVLTTSKGPHELLPTGGGTSEKVDNDFDFNEMDLALDPSNQARNLSFLEACNKFIVSTSEPIPRPPEAFDNALVASVIDVVLPYPSSESSEQQYHAICRSWLEETVIVPDTTNINLNNSDSAPTSRSVPLKAFTRATLIAALVKELAASSDNPKLPMKPLLFSVRWEPESLIREMGYLNVATAARYQRWQERQRRQKEKARAALLQQREVEQYAAQKKKEQQEAELELERNREAQIASAKAVEPTKTDLTGPSREDRDLKEKGERKRDRSRDKKYSRDRSRKRSYRRDRRRDRSRRRHKRHRSERKRDYSRRRHYSTSDSSSYDSDSSSESRRRSWSSSSFSSISSGSSSYSRSFSSSDRSDYYRSRRRVRSSDRNRDRRRDKRSHRDVSKRRRRDRDDRRERSRRHRKQSNSDRSKRRREESHRRKRRETSRSRTPAKNRKRTSNKNHRSSRYSSSSGSQSDSSSRSLSTTSSLKPTSQIKHSTSKQDGGSFPLSADPTVVEAIVSTTEIARKSTSPPPQPIPNTNHPDKHTGNPSPVEYSSDRSLSYDVWDSDCERHESTPPPARQAPVAELLQTALSSVIAALRVEITSALSHFESQHPEDLACEDLSGQGNAKKKRGVCRDTAIALPPFLCFDNSEHSLDLGKAHRMLMKGVAKVLGTSPENVFISMVTDHLSGSSPASPWHSHHVATIPWWILSDGLQRICNKQRAELGHVTCVSVDADEDSIGPEACPDITVAQNAKREGRVVLYGYNSTTQLKAEDYISDLLRCCARIESDFMTRTLRKYIQHWLRMLDTPTTPALLLVLQRDALPMVVGLVSASTIPLVVPQALPTKIMLPVGQLTIEERHGLRQSLMMVLGRALVGQCRDALDAHLATRAAAVVALAAVNDPQHQGSTTAAAPMTTAQASALLPPRKALPGYAECSTSIDVIAPLPVLRVIEAETYVRENGSLRLTVLYTKAQFRVSVLIQPLQVDLNSLTALQFLSTTLMAETPTCNCTIREGLEENGPWKNKTLSELLLCRHIVEVVLWYLSLADRAAGQRDLAWSHKSL